VFGKITLKWGLFVSILHLKKLIPENAKYSTSNAFLEAEFFLKIY